MTRYFMTMDDAYNWVEAMMNHFDHYEVRTTDMGIRVMMF